MPEVRRSVCALDCPDCCSLLVNVDENSTGSKLRGNPDHPVTRGFLCGKVAQYLERQYHPDRLLHPMKRTGAKGTGKFTRIGWNEALDEVAVRLGRVAAEHGPEAILPYSYAGTMGLLNGAGMDRRFFHRLGASRLDRTICAAAGGAALTLSQGIKLGMDPADFAHARLIIAWGANILGTNVHLWPFIVEARRKGAKFYVIDPVINRTGKTADRHFAINPGSDLALALGMVHIILREGWEDAAYVSDFADGFDEMKIVALEYTPERVAAWTGLSISDVELLAHDYATIKPAAIRVNYGVQRSEHGGNAVRAIAALPVLTGVWRYQGGGLQLSTSGAFELNRPALERPDLQMKSALKRESRLVNMSLLGHSLTQMDRLPIKALVVYNSNPAAIAPNQTKVLDGLRREDLFTVVLEQFQTDTADYADIVLPATTFLEHTDLYTAYGHHHLQLARPALPPAGEARSNVEVFRALAKRMGFEDDCFNDTEDEMIESLLDSRSAYLAGITLKELDEKGSVPLKVSPPGEPYLPFARGGFKTKSGRFQFGAESLTYAPPTESRYGPSQLVEKYPYELISSKNDDSMNSTFGHRDEVDRQTKRLQICETDALGVGLVAGDRVKVFNDRGWCFLQIEISEAVKPGVVRAPSVGWNRGMPDRAGINAVTSERLTDLGEGPTFYSCLVNLERVAEPFDG